MEPKPNIVYYFHTHIFSPDDDILKILNKTHYNSAQLLWNYRIQSVKEIELMRKMTQLKCTPTAKLIALELMK